MTFVVALDHDHGRSGAELAPTLGWLGADLHELCTRHGLPVPPGFTMTTELWRHVVANGWDDAAEVALAEGLERLQDETGRRLGATSSPLLVSVRPGGPTELPGIAPPVLDLGCGGDALVGLEAIAGRRFALDTRLALLQRYATVIHGRPAADFDDKWAEARRFADVSHDEDLPVEVLELLVGRFEALAPDVPADPLGQIRGAVRASLAAWDAPQAVALRNRRGVDHAGGMAITVEAMVYGNAGEGSGSGTVWSHDPGTGEPGMAGTVQVRAQGSGEMPGEHARLEVSAAAERLPEAHALVGSWLDRLAADEAGRIIGLDVTVERGVPWVLRSRRRGPSAAARLRVIVEAVGAGDLGRHDAVALVTAADVEELLHGSIDASGAAVLTTGLGASPGAAVGVVSFDADEAAELAASGTPVILVAAETSPEDVHGMAAAAGILTTGGGLASHAAVVARGWGTPAVCGAEEIELADDRLRVGASVVRAGERLAIDGTTGQVLLGDVEVAAADASDDLDTVLTWADEAAAGRWSVRANADTAADAARARAFGATGIGLCRTEHMFLGADRLPLIRQMILADAPEDEARALRKLRRAQKADFTELLEAMDGLPVTVRLLDPPLHEFLPDLAELAVAEATGAPDRDRQALLRAVRTWGEVNPMMGTRGVRLGYLKPGLYEMQVKALLDAAITRRQAGGDPIVEVMIPLTVTGPELAGARRWVTDALADKGEAVADLEVGVGTMIETPRAALCAAELASHAEFFSFGTNDLTQLCFGFSRDDVEGQMMGRYLDLGLLAANPFEHLDADGVGRLVAEATREGRRARPGLKVGLCGEHGGDPASIRVLADVGLDYVSCSPFRVPVARLAVAQALLARDAAGP